MNDKELSTKSVLCPICQSPGCKALVGVFPIKICTDPGCSCAWGFWADIAFWLSDHLTPNDGGWWLMVYDGSYIRAVVAMLRGESGRN